MSAGEDAAATVERVRAVVAALLQLPIPPRPEGTTLAVWCAFEDGWDAALLESETFLRRALDPGGAS